MSDSEGSAFSDNESEVSFAFVFLIIDDFVLCFLKKILTVFAC